jgi:hypothetical protein
MGQGAGSRVGTGWFQAMGHNCVLTCTAPHRGVDVLQPLPAAEVVRAPGPARRVHVAHQVVLELTARPRVVGALQLEVLHPRRVTSEKGQSNLTKSSTFKTAVVT